MDYKNEKHRIAFEEAIRKKDRKKYTLLSALYLLTADCQLWRLVRHCVMNNAICFEQISSSLPNGLWTSTKASCTAGSIAVSRKH